MEVYLEKQKERERKYVRNSNQEFCKKESDENISSLSFF